ncbi:MAG: transcription-repair coupling factor [Patescibacteria group bacterium]
MDNNKKIGLEKFFGKENKLPVNFEFSGLTNTSAKIYYILRHYSIAETKEVIFWCVKEAKEKEKSRDNFDFWQKFMKTKIPVFDLAEISGRLLASLLTNNSLIILCAPEDLLKMLPSSQDFENSTLKLKNGLTLNPARLSQWLINIGYEFSQFATAPGLFARHGGIVEVFPINTDQPVKIEFSGNQIETLKIFDVNSKKSHQSLKEIQISPHRLNFLTPKSSIFDYINRRPTFAYSDPEFFEEFVPRWPEINKKISNFTRIIFQSLKTKKTNILDFKPGSFFFRDFKRLAAEIRNFQKENYKILIATNKEKSLRQLLAEYKIKNNYQLLPLPSDKIRAFSSAGEKIFFLTDYEIFGDLDQEETNSQKKINFSLIYELKPGDLVVHMDHGIALFKGIIYQKVDSLEKEYFCLEYAENDKLFVPIEYAEKLGKYIGESQPKLHRLSGASWLQITRKVQESAENTAKELLKLYASREAACALPLKAYEAEENALAETFRYTETPDQKKAIAEVLEDLSQNKPMDRLICGDVGFGKTEVAMRAAYRAILNKKQVVLLSPTTILTQQHYDTFKNRLDKVGVKVALLSRVDPPKLQKEILFQLKTGAFNIVIGTHRLLSPDVKFKDLGLIIIDEEQRFGVKDKEKLKNLRQEAHVLTLSATPIPRTLNFSLASLRDISLIITPPEGRQAVETNITPYDESLIKKVAEEEFKRQGQVYYLHNQVETINLKASALQKLIPKAKIGVAHGRLSEKDLMEEMRRFDNQETNLLVCSTIIENGLDLPNANTLIVEKATNFGLADLYQLRGRIGRSYKKAFAYFLYESKKMKATARQRLKALLEVKELGGGFELALRDLEIRGSGNILGHKQSGHIRAIGLNLYLRLLNQAIEEVKTGRPTKPLRDIQIDLPLSIGLPKELIPQEAKRLKIYQELASIFDPRELESYRLSFQKKYGPLPASLENLFALLKLKIIGQKSHVSNITGVKINIEGIQKEKVVVNFYEKLFPEKIKKLIDREPAWDFTDEQIKIDKAKLGRHWLSKLMDYVKIFG